MFAKLLFLFIVIPFVELSLLLRMSEATGWQTTLTVVIVTGLIGSYLARREGIAALQRFRQALAEGRMPGREIQDGLMIAFAAALLLTPGLLTDATGFLLLTPLGRSWIGGLLRKRFAGQFQVQGSGFGQSANGPATANPNRPNEPRQADSWHTGPSHQPAGPSGTGSSYTIDAPSFSPKKAR
ncbi:FxsA family protein [Neorhodopirellula lusitana]|uniref:FxsA family protein n=1 Tax=Neorhodopirellula lusitana TaxID=445327 RepID=UPI00385076DB